MLRSAARAIATSQPSAVPHRSVVLATRLARSPASSRPHSRVAQDVLSPLDKILAGPDPVPIPTGTGDSTSSGSAHASDGHTSGGHPRNAGIAQKRKKGLFVGGLTSATDETALAARFAEYSPIQEARLIRTPDGRSRRCGFVYFKKACDVGSIVRASRLCPVFVDGRRVTVDVVHMRSRPSKVSPTTVYVDNLPSDVRRQDLKHVFQGFTTTSQHLRRKSDSTGEVVHFAFVGFATPAIAQSVMARAAVQPFVFRGRPLRVNPVKPDPNRAYPPTATLLVHNLSTATSAGQLKLLFARYGHVHAVRMPQSVSGGRKGFAFVDFASVDQAKAVMEDHEKTPLTAMGQKLIVRYSTPFIPSLYEQGKEHRDIVKAKIDANREHRHAMRMTAPVEG